MLTKCPECHGNGYLTEYAICGGQSSASDAENWPEEREIACERCEGWGTVTACERCEEPAQKGSAHCEGCASLIEARDTVLSWKEDY